MNNSVHWGALTWAVATSLPGTVRAPVGRRPTEAAETGTGQSSSVDACRGDKSLIVSCIYLFERELV